MPAAPQLEMSFQIAYTACTGEEEKIAPHAYQLCLCSWVVLVVALLRLVTVALIEACTETICSRRVEAPWVPLIQKCWR